MTTIRSPFVRRVAPALVAGGLALAVVAGCGEDAPKAQDPAPTTSAPPKAPQSDTTASHAPEPSSSSSAATGNELFLTPFFVGDTPQGPRLFREVHLATADQAIPLLEDGPQDPDYRSLIPAGSLVEGTGFDGTGEDGAFSVELADASWADRPADMTPAQARLAVQQVVWTLQTAAGGKKYDPDARTKAPVHFYLDGKETSYLGVASGVDAAAELKVLAHVNVLTGLDEPKNLKSILVTGVASSFEATVPWHVENSSGQVVVKGFATAEGWMDGLYPWSAEVELDRLPAGTYTFVAATDDPSGGEGGGAVEDSKTFSVQ